MDWWDSFDLWEFIIHPAKYGVPLVDAWIREWGNWLDTFVQTNPWFFGFLTGTGLSWFTWFVMHTPWKWDDKIPDWIKKRLGMKKVYDLTDEVK